MSTAHRCHVGAMAGIAPKVLMDLARHSEINLTMRAYNCLKRAGIARVGEIVERLERGPDEILAIRNFGQNSLAELVVKMQAKGFLAGDYEAGR